MSVRERVAQSMDCRQSMDHIAHRAKPDDENPINFSVGC